MTIQEPAARGPLDRFQWNSGELDEIVLTGVTFHIERMSHHGWWMSVRDPKTGEDVHLWWRAIAEPVVESSFTSAAQKDHGPLLYRCPHRWKDRRGGEHRCELDQDHRRHHCECGATCSRDHGGQP